jgi:hypothetical protein
MGLTMRRSVRLGMSAVVALAGLNALSAFQARAVPRYSARYEQKCGLCHLNPTGGGLRTAYASQKLVPEEIAWSKAKPEVIAGIEPHISKNILIGTDFRELYLGSDAPVPQRDFFQMQGDIYFDFALDPKVDLYFARSATDTRELFGLDYLTPKLYVKAGRFVPSYGWKFDDHTMFVRSEMGFSPPGNSDVGVEVGAYPGRFDIQLAAVNGARGSILDTDTRVATALNAGYRFHLGPLGLAAGISGYDDPNALLRFDAGGGHAYVTWKNLTWLGQGDLFSRAPAGGKVTRGFVTSHEVTWGLHQGLDLKGTYDFFDPDKDHATGAKTRWGGGIFVMPQSYLALEFLERRTTFENGIAYSGNDFYESVFQLHLLY